jgi:hypothetical protein
VLNGNVRHRSEAAPVPVTFWMGDRQPRAAFCVPSEVAPVPVTAWMGE